jgi:hypothetical protein
MARFRDFRQNKKYLCKYGGIFRNFLHTDIIDVL